MVLRFQLRVLPPDAIACRIPVIKVIRAVGRVLTQTRAQIRGTKYLRAHHTAGYVRLNV